MPRVAIAPLLLSLSIFACDSEDSVDTAEPREAAVAGHTAKMMAHLDADENGSISAEEAKGSMFEHHFAKADLDANGEVDTPELDEFTSVMADKHGDHPCDGDCDHHKGHHGMKGHKGFKGHGMHGGSPQEHADKVVAELDADGDGSLAKAEVEGRLAEHFDKMDTDADGVLTRDEFVTAVETKMAKMGKHGGHHGGKWKHHGEPHE